MILLITNERDITCDLVVLRLRERSLPYLRLNTDRFLTAGGITWRLGGDAPRATLRWQLETVGFTDVTAVWYRRPVAPAAPPALRASLAAQHFAVQEGEATLQNLWSLVGRLWISHPAAIRQAEPKLQQLLRASELGMEVPPTLLTNDPGEADTFCSTFREVVAKPLGKGVAGDPVAGTPSVIFAHRLGTRDIARLDAVAHTPTLFQQRIPNQCDVRVTVVGRQVFAAEIHSPAQLNEVDWRRVPVADRRYAPHTLPAALTEQVLLLVRSFGLQFGALDFILTPDGRYVFLEINPNGQWAWLEQIIGTPISDALLALLTGEAEPL